MKKIAFIGAYDKTDLVLYVAKIFQVIGKRMLFVDASILQKAKYIVPVINPTKTYVTEYEDMDVAVGFESFEDIADYLGVEKLDDQYDIAFVDTDTYEGYEKFKLEEAEKNYFITSFDVYSLKKGLEVFAGIEKPIKLTKVLFSRDMKREEDEYLEFLAMNYNIEWEKEKIEFPFDRGDQSILFENQRTSRIKYRNLTSQYKDSLIYLASGLLESEGISSNDVKKAVRNIEKGV